MSEGRKSEAERLDKEHVIWVQSGQDTNTIYCCSIREETTKHNRRRLRYNNCFESWKILQHLTAHYEILQCDKSEIFCYYWAHTSLNTSICYQIINGTFRVSLQPLQDRISFLPPFPIPLISSFIYFANCFMFTLSIQVIFLLLLMKTNHENCIFLTS